MKQFRFRLQTVLEWRRTQQRLEESKLEDLLRQAQGLEREAARCDADRTAAEAAVFSSKVQRPRSATADSPGPRDPHLPGTGPFCASSFEAQRPRSTTADSPGPRDLHLPGTGPFCASSFEAQRPRSTTADSPGPRDPHLPGTGPFCASSLEELLPVELAALDAYSKHLTLEKRRFQREAQKVRDSAAVQRQRLVEARRQVKLLEKLKERQHAHWQAEFARELDNEAADLFLAKWSEPAP